MEDDSASSTTRLRNTKREYFLCRTVVDQTEVEAVVKRPGSRTSASPLTRQAFCLRHPG